MKLFYFLLMISIFMIIFPSANMLYAADERTDIYMELAEHHRQQGEIYEREARSLSQSGNFEEASQKFTLAAEQYSEAMKNQL